MARKHRKLANALLLVAAGIAAPHAMAAEATKPAPLVIQDQGSFAVGGTMTQGPGTFDPLQADRARGPDLSRRSRLRLLPSPGECAEAAARALARRRTILEDLGDDGGRARGISEHLPASRLWRLRDRSAAPR